MKDSPHLIEPEPYIYELIRRISEEIYLLEGNNRYSFYEAIGYMISAEKDLQNQEKMLNDTLGLLMA